MNCIATGLHNKEQTAKWEQPVLGDEVMHTHNTLFALLHHLFFTPFAFALRHSLSSANSAVIDIVLNF